MRSNRKGAELPGSKGEVTVRFDNATLTFHDREAMNLRWMASQLRSGADIPAAGRELLATILEALAEGKPVQRLPKKGRPDTPDKYWWIAADYCIYRTMGEKSAVALALIAHDWVVSESEIRKARRRHYGHLQAHFAWLIQEAKERSLAQMGREATVGQILEAFRDQLIRPYRERSMRVG